MDPFQRHVCIYLCIGSVPPPRDFRKPISKINIVMIECTPPKQNRHMCASSIDAYVCICRSNISRGVSRMFDMSTGLGEYVGADMKTARYAPTMVY